MMVRKLAVCGLLMSATFTMVAFGQSRSSSVKARNPRKVDTYRVTGSAAYGDSLKPDAVIAKALRNVSAEHIRGYDLKLVSFGTRHTMSAADEGSIKAGHGIGAAREWIRSEFERISKDCGDCLEVQTDEFTQPVSDRISSPTQIVNVYAIQRGTDPEQAKRIFLVTGHYDSRNSDGMDTTKLAPGANDDASGTCRIARICARAQQAEVSGNHHLRDGCRRRAGALRQRAFRQDGAQKKAGRSRVRSTTTSSAATRTPGDKEQDATIVRVFSEGIPSTATEKESHRLISFGYDQDGVSRQLARYARIVARAYLPQAGAGRFTPKLVFRYDRFLRGGDHISFNKAGFPAIRFTEYREDFNHQHQTLRTENGVRVRRPSQVCGFRIRGQRCAAERGHAGLARLRAGSSV